MIKIVVPLLLIIALAFALNPSHDAHGDAIVKKCCEYNRKSCTIGICAAMKADVSYQNYYLFSKAYSPVTGATSIGFFGLTFAEVPNF